MGGRGGTSCKKEEKDLSKGEEIVISTYRTELDLTFLARYTGKKG